MKAVQSAPALISITRLYYCHIPSEIRVRITYALAVRKHIQNTQRPAPLPSVLSRHRRFVTSVYLCATKPGSF